MGTPILSLDVIMFAEASVDQISLMENILHSFCRCSRDKVSEEKTHVFFSKDVLRKLWQQICLAYGFWDIGDLGKYLGFLSSIGVLTGNLSNLSWTRWIKDLVLGRWRSSHLRAKWLSPNQFYKQCLPMLCIPPTCLGSSLRRLIRGVNSSFGGDTIYCDTSHSPC